ncbi:S26 family signal peptidase [Roseiconus lacunae]|uniref:S26 family signal peptidase n=1 Tax=Roseiconus lacunae TaxID=2605694 RepID=UPI00308B14A8|nr:S26 family signal peptidase [Stieleria sp. HD01]
MSKRFLSSRIAKMLVGCGVVALLLVSALLGFRLGSDAGVAEHQGTARSDIGRRNQTVDPHQRTTRRQSKFLVRGRSMLPTLSEGQVCDVMLSDQGTLPLRRGDLVAVRFADGNHVKRLAGIPGDRIELQQGRLSFNGNRLEDWIANATIAIPPAMVEVPSNPGDWRRSKEGSWIVYHHRDPYRDDQPGLVHDDYPMNVDVKRGLNPVDRLAIEFKSPSRRRVLFSIGGEVLATLGAGGTARSRDGAPNLQPDAKKAIPPELTDVHPIAVELTPGESINELTQNLRVVREIEFRDDVRRRKARYPIRLGADQYFVLGDNVPVSVDSREIGPLPRSAILGRVVSCR